MKKKQDRHVTASMFIAKLEENRPSSVF